MFLSVVITTYNWPKALNLALNALNAQTSKSFEVIVADDGSTDDTKKLIEKLQQNYSVSLHHVWQEDNGFQAAKIRNKAIAKAKGDFIIFLDGDCVVLPTFIERQIRLIEPGFFLVGNRILLTESFTEYVINKSLPIYNWSLKQWIIARIEKKCNKVISLFNLPFPKKLHTKKWQGAKGCNMGVWKQDLITVNGWDESFVGWGYEDSDLVIRLLNCGIKRKDTKFKTPVIHLWHKENDRSQEKINKIKLEQIINSKKIKAVKGLST